MTETLPLNRATQSMIRFNKNVIDWLMDDANKPHRDSFLDWKIAQENAAAEIAAVKEEHPERFIEIHEEYLTALQVAKQVIDAVHILYHDSLHPQLYTPPFNIQMMFGQEGDTAGE